MASENHFEFMNAVANMRRLQKQYDSCRDGMTRAAKRKAEAKVDSIIEREIGQALKIQQSLFKK